MAISHIADDQTINASSTTSNTVTKPVGTADGDLLVGLFGMISQVPTITDPAALDPELGEQDDGTNLRTRAYTKVAAGEGVSYVWSLTSSIKNVAWLGAYRGVDPDDPVADWASAPGDAGTEHTSPAVDVPDGGWLITAVVTRHAPGAVGVSTWTTDEPGDAERWDAASNAGSADITVAVWDSDGPLAAGSHNRVLTSTETEDLVALWSIALKPAGESAPSSIVPWTVGVPV